MNFASVLNAYCNALKCSNKEIAEKCGISMSALSRYRTGKRMPRVGAGTIDRLAHGISSIAYEKGINPVLTEKEIKEHLVEGLVRPEPIGPSFSIRVDALMKLLRIRNADVAVPMHLDPSYISRIRRGERTPNDKKRFASVVAQVAALSCMEQGMLRELLSLIGAESEAAYWGELNVDTALGLAEVIDRWLLGNQMIESDIVAIETLFADIDAGLCSRVLKTMAESDPILSCPVESEPFSRFYEGEDLIWKAEIDFLETAASYGAEHLYLSNDMPAFGTELALDKIEHYQKAIVDLIRRGCDITVIHDPDKPLRQTIQSMRLWVPLYMTGHVTPLFVEGGTSRVFSHVNNVSECCALVSDAVKGHEESGRYYISTLPEDINYYQRKMGFILERAHSLIEIYHDYDEEGFRKFEVEEQARKAAGRGQEVEVGKYEHLRIFSYRGDCAVIYARGVHEHRFVIRHPKLYYLISHLR